MIRKCIQPPILFLILMLLGLTACQQAPTETVLPENQIKAGVAATLTKQAFVSSLDEYRLTETASSKPTETPQPPDPPTPTPEPTRTPRSHFILPGSPSGRNTFVTDLITVDLAKDKTATGDNYNWSRLERPYTAVEMEYRDYLDIMRVDFQASSPYTYLTFVLIGDLPQEGDIRYMVELDTDHDGAGDVLVMAALPPDDKWTTDNVWVLADEDDDIGGLYKLYPDQSNPDQNGYETELFANGKGDDPDLAWVRRDPDQTNQIQIAYKKELNGVLGILWSAWTDEGIKDPGLFDFNDHFTFDEAGSPSKDNYRYPVKAVALVDSTCRSWYGYIPSGQEPGLCFTSQQPGEQPGMGYCVSDFSDRGCIGSCLTSCPPGKVCVPCQKK